MLFLPDLVMGKSSFVHKPHNKLSGSSSNLECIFSRQDVVCCWGKWVPIYTNNVAVLCLQKVWREKKYSPLFYD